jgi:adenosylmethionine-8-amino-7-oxononanoate transaminase
VFFSDSGATAVEIGVKVAFGYWRRVGRSEKSLFVAFDNGYHGDTIGSMSVGGIDLFHSEFGPLLFECERVTFPHAYGFPGTEEECARASLGELERLFGEQAHRIACLVVEPLVQAAAGMRMMPPGFLRELELLCRKHDVLLLADEVATGFGRTGELFACEHEDVEPDIMTLGKGLTGGYLPVAATLVSDAIYEAFYGDFAELKALYHGHSFTGNQLGCSVALASLDLFDQDRLVEHVQESSRLVAHLLEPIAALPGVGDVRQRGLMVGVELLADDWRDRTGQRVCARARELGMLTRPLGDVVVFMPPLVSDADDLEAMVSILHDAIDGVVPDT